AAVAGAGEIIVEVDVAVAAAADRVEMAQPRHRIAGVGRAGIAVIADDGPAGLTETGCRGTSLDAIAEVAVVAVRIAAAAVRDIGVHARPVAVRGRRIAAVCRAGHGVVARRRRHDGLAHSVDAGLLAVAELAVVADDRGAGARAVGADVFERARVLVVAPCGIVRMRTGAEAIAVVVGAGVPVVGARGVGRAGAAPGRVVARVVALVTGGTRIPAVHRAGAATAPVGPVAEDSVVARRAVGLEAVRRAAGARARTELRHVALVCRRPTLGRRGLEGVGRATVTHPVAHLGDVADARRGSADGAGRALRIGRAARGRPVAGLRHVAGAGRRAAHRAGVARRVLAGVLAPVALIERARVAVVGARHPARFLCIRGTRGTRPRAGLCHVALARRGATHGGRRLEAVGRARIARTVAGLRHVADAR